MRKENVFPTRRSVVPTLSVNRTNVYLNTDFGLSYYKNSIGKPLYVTYQKKGKKFYLFISKEKIRGMVSFSCGTKTGTMASRQNVYVTKFSELKSSDVSRFECIPVKSNLKGIDVYELKPHAFDSVKSLELFDFKILK